jgi:hypothetical protein
MGDLVLTTSDSREQIPGEITQPSGPIMRPLSALGEPQPAAQFSGSPVGWGVVQVEGEARVAMLGVILQLH